MFTKDTPERCIYLILSEDVICIPGPILPSSEAKLHPATSRPVNGLLTPEGKGRGHGESWKGLGGHTFHMDPTAPWIPILTSSSTIGNVHILSTSQRCHNPKGEKPWLFSHHLQAPGRTPRTGVLSRPRCPCISPCSCFYSKGAEEDGRRAIYKNIRAFLQLWRKVVSTEAEQGGESRQGWLWE